MQDDLKTSYNSEHLKMLSTVLEESMAAMIDAKGTTLSEAQIQTLAAHLGKFIMDRFTAGETDPERLKRLAVESVQPL